MNSQILTCLITRNKSRLWRRLWYHETTQWVTVCHYSAVPSRRHYKNLLQVVLALALAGGEAAWGTGARAARLLRSTCVVLGHQILQLLQRKRPNRALICHWRCNLLCHLFQMLQLYLLLHKKRKYGPISILFLKCWISKSTDYDSEQQKHSKGYASSGRMYSKSVIVCIRPCEWEGSWATQKSQ